jgi:hypothetical protein
MFHERPDVSPEAMLAAALHGDAAFNAGPMRVFLHAVRTMACSLPTCSPGFPLAVKGLAMHDVSDLHAAACTSLGMGQEGGCHVRRDAWLPLTWLLVRNLSDLCLVGVLSAASSRPSWQDEDGGKDASLHGFFLALSLMAFPTAACPARMASDGERCVRATLVVDVATGDVAVRLLVSEPEPGSAVASPLHRTDDGHGGARPRSQCVGEEGYDVSLDLRQRPRHQPRHQPAAPVRRHHPSPARASGLDDADKLRRRAVVAWQGTALHA